MIFFGTKGKVVAGEAIQGVTCPSCDNGQFVTFGILRYFHLYWIPTIPTSKKVGMECTHCKNTLVDDEIPPNLIEQIKPGIFSAGRVLPMFSGLIIIGLLALGLMYSVQQDNAREATYLAQPAVDGYYVVDFSKIFVEVNPEYKYGVMRVVSVDSASVDVRISNIAYNLTSGVTQDIRDGKAASDSYYEPELVNFTFEELDHYDDTGVIHSIDRR